MKNGCPDCKSLARLKHRIIQTQNWIVWLPNNQAWFGRACIHLRNHKANLSELTETEWQEYIQLVKLLEPAYKRAFGAYPLNWACNMNNAFRTEPVYPHVHWHIFPRYKEAPVFNGVLFEDRLYGEHYDPNAQKLLEEDMLAQIAAQLRASLPR